MNYRVLSLCISVAVVSAVCAPALGVTFTFDELSPWSGPAAISGYMSDLYGSEVSVRGAMAGPIFPGDSFGPDGYLFSTVQAGGPRNFPFSIDIGFEADAAIGSVQFEGAIFGNNPGHDFRMWAYTDGGTKLVSVTSWDTPRGHGAYWFDSGLMTFGTAVDRLVFSDNWIYDVAINDLAVSAWASGAVSAPTPTSTVLGSLGLLFVGLAMIAKRRAQGWLGATRG